MNSKTLAINLSWLTAGVLITLAVQHLVRPSADHSQSIEVAQVSVPTPAPVQAAMPAAVVPPAVTIASQALPEPRKPAAMPPVSTASAAVIEKAALYAQSFQPGIYGEEGMPEFALSHFFPTEGGMTPAAVAEYNQIHKSPPDAWGIEMNERLRAFFSEQQDLSNSHVSIGCRISECQLQLVELNAPEDTPGMANSRMQSVLRRLLATPWFREQFAGLGPGGVTPDGTAVRYMALRLMRKT